MADITLNEVIQLVDQLAPEELAALEEYLHNRATQQKLSIGEKKALLDSLVINVGEVLPGYSDRREDWYDDEGR